MVVIGRMSQAERRSGVGDDEDCSVEMMKMVVVMMRVVMMRMVVMMMRMVVELPPADQIPGRRQVAT